MCQRKEIAGGSTIEYAEFEFMDMELPMKLQRVKFSVATIGVSKVETRRPFAKINFTMIT